MKTLKSLMIDFFVEAKESNGKESLKEITEQEMLCFFDAITDYRYSSKTNFYGFRESLLAGKFLKPTGINLFAFNEQKFFERFSELEKKYKKIGGK